MAASDTNMRILEPSTNRLGWSRGYFKTLPGPVESVGEWGLDSFRTIDDDLSQALGFELAPD